MTITLVTDVLPDERFTAGQVLRKIFSHLQAERVDVFWLNQSRLPSPPVPEALFQIKREYRFELPPPLSSMLDRAVTRLGRTSKACLLLQLIVTSWHCVYIAASVIRQRRRSKDDILWLVLQGEKLLFVYWLISRFESRRIVLQQWDPLSWWMVNRNHRPGVVGLMKTILQKLQRRVWLNIVPSAPWEAELTAAGFHAVRTDNFFSPGELKRSRAITKLCAPGKLNVVFAGQLYASAELRSCIAILAENAAKLRLSVVLHYFGSAPCPHIGRAELVGHGFVTPADLIAAIGKWDLALLPYPLEKRFSETARLSFPSKSRIYVAAGLPILAHAPEGSSIHQFFTRHYSDYYVNSAVQPDFAEYLRACKDASPARLRARRDVTERLAAEWFSEQAEMKPLMDLLGAGKACHGNTE